MRGLRLRRKKSDLEGRTATLLRQFDVAFALMSVIPLLICCYLIAAKFFSLEIFVGLNGVYFLLATMIALLGILFGRQLARSVMNQLVEVKSEADWLISQVVGIDELLSLQSGERMKVKNALERAKGNILGRERLIIELQQEVDTLKKEIDRLAK